MGHWLIHCTNATGQREELNTPAQTKNFSIAVSQGRRPQSTTVDKWTGESTGIYWLAIDYVYLYH